MTENENQAPLSEAEQLAAYEAWLKKELDSHVTHLFKHGVIEGKVQVGVMWALPGRLCIGMVVSTTDKSKAFWVISGDVPTDHLALKQATSAREAAKHFAMKWQLQAARLVESQSVGRSDDDPKLWNETGSTLTRKAEALYALAEDDTHWQPVSAQ